MKKVLFVINTLGGAGAEKALLELLKRFTPDRYEVDLYVLLEQGELVSQVPGYVNMFFVKHFSLKKASEFPVFSEGFSLL